jgi:hypothetical protein
MPYGRMSADSIAYLGYPPALPSFPAITLPTAVLTVPGLVILAEYSRGCVI